MLEDAARSVERVRDFIRRLDRDAPEPEGMDAYLERFLVALADDFNTAMARGVLFEWISEGNRRLDPAPTRRVSFSVFAGSKLGYETLSGSRVRRGQRSRVRLSLCISGPF